MDKAALEKAGFVADSELVDSHAQSADKRGMHKGGEYVVHGAWRRGAVALLFEQNTAAEPMEGGLTATVTHPAVCVVSSPYGRVACNAADTALILAIADDLA